MAHFYDPSNMTNYNENDLILKKGESRRVCLWGGGPSGEDLDVYISKSGIISRSNVTPYPRVDHSRIFTVTALKKGRVEIYGLLGKGGPRWATMFTYVSGKSKLLREPDRIAQWGPWMCWAAALQSYLSSYGRSMFQHQLKAKYATDTENGALSSNELKAREYLIGKNRRGLMPSEEEFCKSHNLEYLLKQEHLGIEPHPSTQVNFDLILNTLENRGRFIALLNKVTFSHCLVVYGCTESGEIADDDLIHLMDPNDGGGFNQYPIRWFKDVPEVYFIFQG